MVAGTATRNIEYKTNLKYTLAKKTQATKPYIPPELGKSDRRFEDRANNVGFYQACVEARGPHELNKLPRNQHPASALLENMRVHGVPIPTKRGMTDTELTRAIRYSTHSSATKETTFVAEECAPYRIARVILVSVIPLFVGIGTPCTRMCSRSADAGCWFLGSLFSLWGHLASKHA